MGLKLSQLNTLCAQSANLKLQDHQRSTRKITLGSNWNSTTQVLTRFARGREHETHRVLVRRVGVTKHSVSLVGELVFVDISAKPNYNVDASDEVGAVEGKDRVRGVLSPVARKVVTNEDVAEDPSLIDEGDEGWPLGSRSSLPLRSTS